MSFKIGWLVIMLGLIGCGSGDVSLTPEEKIVVDSLYTSYSGREGKVLDSICAIEKDTVIKRAIDSITKVRIKEIEQLISR
jgi:hypothetical protein